MVPTFKTDTPVAVQASPEDGNGNGSRDITDIEKEKGLVIGARMPYDLPLTLYARGDEPWCATKSYEEPDWKGQAYNVTQRRS